MPPKDIIEAFVRIDDPKTMRQFFREIFSRAEQTDIALRWSLMTLLHQKMPQRKIASHLGVSLCKITRGARIVKNETSVTNRLLNE